MSLLKFLGEFRTIVARSDTQRGRPAPNKPYPAAPVRLRRPYWAMPVPQQALCASSGQRRKLFPAPTAKSWTNIFTDSARLI